MLRRVDKMLVEHWLLDNAPGALKKLSAKAQISINTIHRARHGQAPQQIAVLLKFARALGVDVERAFPLVSDENAAS